eukprot:scaffold366629_cov42-Prasinocladus_malaysianus.AAC.1
MQFVEVVDQMGGPDKATPSAILKQMKVDGLVLSHVKSHLQKYRGELKKLKDQEAKRAESNKAKKLKQESEAEEPSTSKASRSQNEPTASADTEAGQGLASDLIPDNVKSVLAK